MDACRLLLPSESKNSGTPLYQRCYASADPDFAKTLKGPDGRVKKSCEKQLYLLELLAAGEKSLNDLLMKGISRSTVKTLETKGAIKVVLRQTYRNPLAFAVTESFVNEENRLNGEQRTALGDKGQS